MKKTHLEIRQADPNWIKSIWILLSLLFPQCTQYYPPFPVTVSWTVCITQLLIKILRSYGIDSCASIIEPPMQNNDVPIVPICAVQSASPLRPAHGEKAAACKHRVNDWRTPLDQLNMYGFRLDPFPGSGPANHGAWMLIKTQIFSRFRRGRRWFKHVFHIFLFALFEVACRAWMWSARGSKDAAHTWDGAHARTSLRTS